MAEVVWLMDSECCEKCGCILGVFEFVLCADCLHDAWFSDDEALWDAWFFEDEEESEPPDMSVESSSPTTTTSRPGQT